MERALPGRWIATFALIVVTACMGGETGEAPADTDGPGCRAKDRCGAQSVAAFEDKLGGVERCNPPPVTVDELTAAADVVVFGELAAVVAGRKEYLEGGCADAGSGPQGEPCRVDPNAVIHRSYVDLVVRPSEVVKGTLASSSGELHIEFPWPNNLDVDEVVASAPVGTRVIVLAKWVLNALDGVGPLVNAGVVATAAVADNLGQVGCYGLAFEEARAFDTPDEAVDGPVSPAFGGRTLVRLIGASSNVRFAAARDAIRRSLERSGMQ